MDVAIINRDLPLVRSEIARLTLTLSPQTGGCESDRDSALGEGLPRHEQQTDTEREHCKDVKLVGTRAAHGILPQRQFYGAGSISVRPRRIISGVIGPWFTSRTMPSVSTNTEVGTPRNR